MLIFAHFLIFSLYQRPPDFVVFGVLWTPYRKWWAPIQMIFYLTRFLIIWALVDRNWMISLGCTVVLVQPWPRITFCQKGPKKGVFGEPRPHLRSRDHVTPKRHFLTREHVVWAINHQNWFSGSGCSPVKEKRKKIKIKKKKTKIDMKWGLRSSGPREPIRTIFCRGGHVRAKMSHASFGVSRFIGLGAMRGTNVRLCL